LHTVTGTEALPGELVWLKAVRYGGQSIKRAVEVRDALLCYSRQPGKTVIKDI
jgi:hypothetical protein